MFFKNVVHWQHVPFVFCQNSLAMHDPFIVTPALSSEVQVMLRHWCWGKIRVCFNTENIYIRNPDRQSQPQRKSTNKGFASSYITWHFEQTIQQSRPLYPVTAQVCRGMTGGRAWNFSLCFSYDQPSASSSMRDSLDEQNFVHSLNFTLAVRKRTPYCWMSLLITISFHCVHSCCICYPKVNCRPTYCLNIFQCILCLYI